MTANWAEVPLLSAFQAYLPLMTANWAYVPLLSAFRAYLPLMTANWAYVPLLARLIHQQWSWAYDFRQ